MKKEKNTYITPLLTVVEFKAERGYAYSFANVTEAGQQVELQLQGYLDMAHSEAGVINDRNSFVGGYMNGAAEDNSDPVSGTGWTFENGSYF